MTSLTREQFQERLLQCIEDAVDLAQALVAEPLPRFYRFELAAFARAGEESWLDDVMAHLYRDGSFPRVIDIAVVGVINGAKIIWIRPSGHPYVNEVDSTFFQPAHTVPFKPIGPLHRGMESPPTSLRDLEAIAPTWAREAEEQTGMLRQVLDAISDDWASRGAPSLRRFWIIFERTEEWFDHDPSLPRPSAAAKFGITGAFSCGVTAETVEDALSLVQDVIFRGQPNPPVLAILHDVDFSLLGRNIRISAIQTRDRGIWYPPQQSSEASTGGRGA